MSMKNSDLWRIGIIGAGMIAGKHVRDLLGTRRCAIATVADKIPKLAQAMAAAHGIEKTTEDYREILEDRSIDAVVIATPPWTHKDIFLDALDADAVAGDRAGGHQVVEGGEGFRVVVNARRQAMELDQVQAIHL